MKQRKKRIGLTQRVEYIEEILERRNALSQEWEHFAKECGFLPIILPNEKDLALEIVENLQLEGLIFTGGNDLVAYGGNAKERDDTEKVLLQYALQKEIPLLGVCRGMELILHYFLVPLREVEGHIRVEHELKSGNFVNSYHSLAGMKEDAKKEFLIQEVCKKDDVVEQIQHKKYKNIYGMMWHPERYHPFRKQDIEFISQIFSL